MTKQAFSLNALNVLVCRNYGTVIQQQNSFQRQTILRNSFGILPSMSVKQLKITQKTRKTIFFVSKRRTTNREEDRTQQHGLCPTFWKELSFRTSQPTKRLNSKVFCCDKRSVWAKMWKNVIVGSGMTLGMISLNVNRINLPNAKTNCTKCVKYNKNCVIF